MANNPKGPLKWLSFLRSPLASKPELAAPAAAEVNPPAAAEKSERKRQIDFVRKEELNYLRKLHQTQADSEHPQSWSVLPSSLLADSEDRAQTLKKINEIEAQMSEQDWATEPLSSMPAGDRAASDPAPLQAVRPPEAVPLTLVAPTPIPTKSRVAPELEHAAIGFAKGDDAGVEQELLGYLERDQAHSELAKVWLNALLGLYRATDQQALLEVRAAEFKRRFGVDSESVAKPGLDASAQAWGPRLVGSITGDAAAVLENLDASSHGMKSLVIDCRGLIRLDFSATVSLLNWAAQRQAEACEIQFQNAHPLVAAFLNVVGIGEHAGIDPSGYGDDVS